MNVRHKARTYEKPERLNVRVLVRETGLEFVESFEWVRMDAILRPDFTGVLKSMAMY